MGFLHRKTSKQTAKLRSLLESTVPRVAVARRPRIARKSIACGDVSQLLTLGHHGRALHRAEQVIHEDNMLEAFDIIELYCKRLIEQAAQLDNPQECGEEISEAAASIIFAAGWCSDLPELLFARTLLADKFGSDFATAAKEGTGVVDPMLVWKLSGDRAGMELKKKVTKEIAAENNMLVDFSEIPEADEEGDVPHRQELNHNNMLVDFSGLPEADKEREVSHRQELNQNMLVDFTKLPKADEEGKVSHHQELNHETSCQEGMEESSDLDNDYTHSRRITCFGFKSSNENVSGISNSDESGGVKTKGGGSFGAHKELNLFCIRLKL